MADTDGAGDSLASRGKSRARLASPIIKDLHFLMYKISGAGDRDTLCDLSQIARA
jgi:hypothetical protein